MENNIRRLKSIERSSDFLHLKNSGKKFKCCNWLLINYINNDTQSLRLGLTVSRQIGNAVIRNKLKRWCRVYFRSVLNNLDKVFGMDVNVIFRPVSKEFYQELTHEELNFQLARFKFKFNSSKNEPK